MIKGSYFFNFKNPLKLSFKNILRFGRFPGVLLLAIIALVVLSNCEDLEPERVIKVSIDTITNITSTSSLAKATLLDPGEGEVEQHGFCWAKTQNPTIDINHSQLGSKSSAGDFTDSITGLRPSTLYYVRAYAKLGEKVVYDEQKSFSTLAADTLNAEFSATPAYLLLEQSVQFTDLSSGIPTAWEWNFGDGNTAISQHPVFTFASAGSYTIILIVTDGYTYDIETRVGYVIVNEEESVPIAEFIANQTIIAEGQSLQFTDKSANFPTSWNWTFGDGATSTSQNPSYSYSSEGTYTVRLTATNIYGFDTKTKTNYITVYVDGIAPIADFTVSETYITEGQSVQFTDQSTNSPTSWNWTFGDGETSTLQNPSHSYANEGTYTVSLTATNSSGSDTETKTDFISVDFTGNEPVADFESSDREITAGQSVQFSDDSWFNPTSWSWIFGDGGSSNLENPSYIYTDAGEYTVSLTVTNDYGSDTETKIDYILVAGSGGETGTVDDIDGNAYNTIQIGSQWWMVENLYTTRYADGSDIPLIEDATSWGNLGDEDDAFCYYEDSIAVIYTYGALYTWAAAMHGQNSSDNNPSGVQGVCPTGWHLPSDDEWKELEMELGMSQSEADGTGYRGTNEGSKLAGNVFLWNDGDLENDGAFGSSGFMALPGGYREGYTGTFDNLGYNAYFWSATEYSSSYAWYRGLHYSASELSRDTNYKNTGFSVRCTKD